MEGAALEGDADLRAGPQGREIAGADALADLPEHGAVLDDRDADVDSRARVVGVLEPAAGANAKLPRA